MHKKKILQRESRDTIYYNTEGIGDHNSIRCTGPSDRDRDIIIVCSFAIPRVAGVIEVRDRFSPIVECLRLRIVNLQSSSDIL